MSNQHLDDLDEQELKIPYLVQTGEINSPLAEPSTRISAALRQNYMGAAEFEFGALPKSLRRLEYRKANWTVRKILEITENEAPLRVFSARSDEDFAIYRGYLLQLRADNAGKFNLKEPSRFEQSKRVTYATTNFWWDIRNDVMFSFHKMFMNRLSDYVTASLAVMNAAPTKA
jgi:hypothetical protein